MAGKDTLTAFPVAVIDQAVRARELAVLRGILGNGEPERPLTLAVVVGAGGVGKTSMALRWLHEVRGDYPGGS